MEMAAVDSSQLESIGRDPETSKCHIRFASKRGGAGSLYEYDDVTQEEVDAIINAESLGRVFAATLKFGKNYRKLE